SWRTRLSRRRRTYSWGPALSTGLRIRVKLPILIGFQAMLRVLPRPLRPAVLTLAGLVAACATQPHAAPPAVPAVPPLSSPIAQAPQALKFAPLLLAFRATALQSGIAAPTYDRAMTGLTRNSRVEQANLNQPEFSKPVWDYLDGAVSADRIA